MGLGGQPTVIDTTVETYIEYNQFEHFRARKCHHFERTAHNLWIFLTQYNALKGLPSVPSYQGYFLRETKPGFQSTAAIKQQRQLCQILEGSALVAAGGMGLQHYNANGGGGGYWRKRTS